jgi:hypothetical protein
LAGIPGRVLNDLVRTGDFEIHHSVKPLNTGYHEADIRAFLAKLLALVPKRRVGIRGQGITVQLGNLLSSKFGTARSKARIIRAVLAGEIQVLGSADGTVRGIQLSGRQCEKYTHFWKPQKTVSKSRAETARLLECDVDVIHGLVKLGLLDGYYKGAALRITLAAIKKFRRRFTFLNPLARQRGLSCNALAPRCRAKGIQMLYVYLPGSGGKQPFVKNDDRKRILALASSNL